MKKLLLFLGLILIPSFIYAAPPTSSYTYRAGETISPSEVQQNESNIYNYLTLGVDTYADGSIVSADIYDGTIANADISESAGIVDTKLATISTTGKVSGAAFTGLASIPSDAGIIPTVNIETAAWTNYFSTSTITGWSATPTGYIYYKKIGKTVFVIFSILGTSNSTGATFTVPYVIATVVQGITCGYTRDNGTATTTGGVISIVTNGSTITLYKDMSGLNSWTNSGTKEIIGQFWYEASS